jgi:methylenetetrahydrofolate dehydrogenase (NADP+)/methenyltetrahydrofolate cyclohydrolase
VTATILDGKATAAAIKDDLRSRVKALAELTNVVEAAERL